ncbi:MULTISPECIES: Cof-type HAD-IIB family hydrolase [Cytobacillus]|jgi:Cof subfamily protein (haloacid dehalogenase superfamily)|uniref:Phosphatase n=3 Tax=Cytobacillus TaxID=2675230 RepID=A0A160M8L3_9BACI|nr:MULTISPECIES: Cof-type HAD-IIB family hydrolase [Cytobacillus]EFV78882.1 YitU protein [Bacillus sp. 2_A_57_CT2]AND38937.1 phosphatase [Cytobacillus oceanisediminis 2691]MBU8731968.1 Cof-type HAD-IIB family hydrolase [Cytobacillus oceanisediminis]MBU8768117.1 Cof-type HAD-IIB family hydrolase [Cytobacillus oceanisediminis]MBY0157033.1 Cof-type HAD-IIB family hydrolase [Cytobacillus firmus]
MAEKHLIALDLDGTLLKDDKTISAKTKMIIQKAREQGHEVMIATGRPFRSSEIYYREMGLTTPIVNFNGAYIHHPKDHNWGVYHTPLQMNVAKEIVEAVNSYTVHNIVAEVIDDVYLHYHDEKLLDIFGFGDPKITTGDLRNYLNDNPTSMLIHTDEEHVKTIRAHLSEVHAEVIDHRRWAAPWHVIEIVKTGLNKAVGLQKAADYFQIPPERIIAFGDEDNDLEMLEYAGYGIAMGNAIDQVKNIANEVTLTNEEDGIGIYLNELLNLKAL